MKIKLSGSTLLLMLHAARLHVKNADVLFIRVGLMTWQSSTLSHDNRLLRFFIAQDGRRKEGWVWGSVCGLLHAAAHRT
jgi:hypothetical protein